MKIGFFFQVFRQKLLPTDFSKQLTHMKEDHFGSTLLKLFGDSEHIPGVKFPSSKRLDILQKSLSGPENEPSIQ